MLVGDLHKEKRDNSLFLCRAHKRPGVRQYAQNNMRDLYSLTIDFCSGWVYNMYVRNERERKMDTFLLIMLALIGGLIGTMVGMGFATGFEYDKKHVKAALVYIACIVTMSLVFVMPVLIICM